MKKTETIKKIIIQVYNFNHKKKQGTFDSQEVKNFTDLHK